MMKKEERIKRHAIHRSILSAVIAFILLTTCMVSAYAQTSTTKTEQLENIFTTSDLIDASITELQEELTKGNVTSVDLVQMYLDRIEAYDKSLDLNSIISINENALETAKALDEERAAGKVRGVLHGIPIIVKDNYDVEGLATSAGAVALKDSIAPDDATVVEKLEDAGAIILAKANLSEFAMSGSNSRSTLGGTVHNAYDNTRTAAGSSGGTAVSITSNFAAAGLGTDTGSSIRRPSSFSNLYGLRPSTGLTSRDGVVPLNMDRDVTGPMCRTVEDLAILMDVIAGSDSADEWTAEADSYIPEDGYTSYLNEDGLEGKRIGYLTNSFGYYYTSEDGENVAVDSPVALDSKIEEITENAINTLVEGGAELVDMSEMLPETLIKELSDTGYVDVFEWDLNTYLESLGENATMKSMWDIKENGGHMTDSIESAHNPETDPISDPRATEEYEQMKAKMLNFRETVNEILAENDIDAVVFISQTDVADKEETSDNKNNAASYLNKFGPVAGLPEMMIPMGFAETDAENGYDESMPLGMSMFSSYGNEATLIEIAYAYEQIADNIRMAPSSVPALEDENVNEFLSSLISEVSEMNPQAYTQESWNDVALALADAEAVDTVDAAATYDAALALAEAYDGLVAATSDEESTSSQNPTSSQEPTSSQTPTSSQDPTSSTNTSSSAASNNSSTDSIKTGEDSLTIMILALILIGTGGAFVARRLQVKTNQVKNNMRKNIK